MWDAEYEIGIRLKTESRPGEDIYITAKKRGPKVVKRHVFDYLMELGYQETGEFNFNTTLDARMDIVSFDADLSLEKPSTRIATDRAGKLSLEILDPVS